MRSSITVKFNKLCENTDRFIPKCPNSGQTKLAQRINKFKLLIT